MNRRNFLSLFSAGVAGLALEQAIPLGRVWSFPKEIVIPTSGVLGRVMGFDWSDEVTVGSLTPIRIPRRFEIGDIVSIPAFSPRRYIVTKVVEADGTVYLADHKGKEAGIVAPSALHAIQQWKFAGFDPDFRRLALKDGY